MVTNPEGEEEVTLREQVAGAVAGAEEGARRILTGRPAASVRRPILFIVAGAATVLHVEALALVCLLLLALGDEVLPNG